MIKLLPILLLILLLSASAHAAAFELVLSDGSPIIVELLAPLPDRFAEAVNSPPATIIHHADFYSVDGGMVTGPDSFDYLPPIAPTNLPQSLWSFSLSTGNAAKWRIDTNYIVYPDYVTIGVVVYGFDALASLAGGGHATVFGIPGVPVDPGGNPYVIDHFYEIASRTLDVPGPETLAILFPFSAALPLTRRSHVPRTISG